MNEIQRNKAAEEMILETRNRFSDLPEPERTYAVEKWLCKEIIRMKEEIQEVNWGGGG